MLGPWPLLPAVARCGLTEKKVDPRWSKVRCLVRGGISAIGCFDMCPKVAIALTEF